MSKHQLWAFSRLTKLEGGRPPALRRSLLSARASQRHLSFPREGTTSTNATIGCSVGVQSVHRRWLPLLSLVTSTFALAAPIERALLNQALKAASGELADAERVSAASLCKSAPHLSALLDQRARCDWEPQRTLIRRMA